MISKKLEETLDLIFITFVILLICLSPFILILCLQADGLI